MFPPTDSARGDCVALPVRLPSEMRRFADENDREGPMADPPLCAESGESRGVAIVRANNEARK